MLICLGDYLLCSVIKEVITIRNFNYHRRLEHIEKLCRCSIVVSVDNACRDVVCRAWNLQRLSKSVVSRFRIFKADVEPVKVLNLVVSKCQTLSKFDNMPTAEWIIPPSLRNNGLHCVLVQVMKFVGYFSRKVPFSLCRELSSFSHLKQRNGVHPCMAYVLSHDGVSKKRFLNIWMDVFGFCCLQVDLLK